MYVTIPRFPMEIGCYIDFDGIDATRSSNGTIQRLIDIGILHSEPVFVNGSEIFAVNLQATTMSSIICNLHCANISYRKYNVRTKRLCAFHIAL